MSPELFFWYGLALKMVMTATIVVVASVAVERSGPFIGALIAALPSAAGAAYIILAIEHPPAFIAGSAVGSLAANAVVAIFTLTYAALAQRHGIVLSLSVATLIWLAAAAGLRLVDWTPASAVALVAVVYAVTIPLSARYRGGTVPREKLKRTAYDIPLRALTAAVVVAVVTTASHAIGAFASGIVAVFAIVMGSFVVIASAHRRQGGQRVRARAVPAGRPRLGLPGAALSGQPLGSWWAMLVGLAVWSPGTRCCGSSRPKPKSIFMLASRSCPAALVSPDEIGELLPARCHRLVHVGTMARSRNACSANSARTSALILPMTSRGVPAVVNRPNQVTAS